MAIQQGGVAICDKCGAHEPVALLSVNDDGSGAVVAFDPMRFPPKGERQWKHDAPTIVSPHATGKLLCPDCQLAPPPAPEVH